MKAYRLEESAEFGPQWIYKGDVDAETKQTTGFTLHPEDRVTDGDHPGSTDDLAQMLTAREAGLID